MEATRQKDVKKNNGIKEENMKKVGYAVAVTWIDFSDGYECESRGDYFKTLEEAKSYIKLIAEKYGYPFRKAKIYEVNEKGGKKSMGKLLNLYYDFDDNTFKVEKGGDKINCTEHVY